MKAEELKLVTEWDKTFPESDKVDHSKVTFVNRYGITLAADMYVPKDAVPLVQLRNSVPDSMPRLWLRGDFLPLLLILPLQGRVPVSQDTWHLLTSIPKISWQLWTFFRYAKR